MLSPNIYSKADLFAENDTPLIISLSESITDDVLAPYFRRAERENLRSVIGESLFEYLRAPLSSTLPASPIAVALREACAEFVGCHALAKYWPFAQTKLTYGGQVRKRVDQSEPIDPVELIRQQNEFLNSAKSYEAQLRKYLVDNRAALQLLTNEPATCDAAPIRSSSPVKMLAIRKDGRGERRRAA